MTTTPTASPELPDLDKLEALARAATPGPWAYQEDSDAYTHIVRPVSSPGWIIASATQTSKPEGEANGRWIAAANPAAVLALIALARRAQPEGEAPQAVAGSIGDDEEFRTLLDRHYYATPSVPGGDNKGKRRALIAYIDSFLKPAATLSPLCGAQHAESGKESGSIGDLAEFHILLNWYDNEASYGSINDGRNKLTEYIDKWAARRADPQAATPGVQPAQEQASTTRVTETKRAQLEARGYEVVGYVMQNSVNELCTLAHGRVEWLGKGTVTDYGTSAPGTPEAPQTAAARDVLAERQRQVEQEGWTPAHDDAYVDGQLASAAVAYAQAYTPYLVPSSWPWAVEWFKAGDDRRNMVKAGALILAEIERLDRAAQLDGGQEGSAT